MSEFEFVLYEVADNVARITLNDPTTRNCLSAGMRRDIIAALRLAERDDDASVILLQGAGPTFCSGYDLRGYTPPEGGYVSARHYDLWMDQFARSCVRDWLTIWDCVKPVVAKVQGACLAGGTELMSMCDVVFVADNAKLGYPPTRQMSSPDTSFFPWKMSMAQAKYMQLTGMIISGKQACEWGWVIKSFAPEELDEKVEIEVAALASIPPDLLALNKGAMNQAYEMLGFKNTVNNGVHWHMVSMARVRPNAGIFQKVQAEHGIKGAIERRDEKFATLDFKG